MKAILTSTLLFTITFFQAQTSAFNFSIHFESGKHNINSTSTLTLNQIANHININKIDTVNLYGHTDPKGDIAYNEALSERRVKSVHEYLKHFKLKCHFKLDHFGERKLLTKKKNIHADSLNRRVEIFYAKYSPISSADDSLYGIKKMDKKSIIYQFDPNTRLDTAIYFKNLDKTCKDLAGKKTHVLVMDWTRSVYAYGTSMINWYKRNRSESNFEHIVLFNDGNKKATHRKRLGDTGGIYSGEIDSLTSILHLMEKVAKKGTGGDFPENVIEALLFAQEEFPQTDTLVLLADNEACIRDYKLTHLLKKPVKIIVNQVNPIDKIVNYQFFSIAAHTNGSVFLNEEEFHDLSFKSKFGPQPTPMNDTLIVLGKKRKMSYKKAKKEHSKTKRSLKIMDKRPVLMINNTLYDWIKGSSIGKKEYTTGKMNCSVFEYSLTSHAKFKEKYTFWQKTQNTCGGIIRLICSPFKKKPKKRKFYPKMNKSKSKTSSSRKPREQ